jgi:hypothetical protein
MPNRRKDPARGSETGNKNWWVRNSARWFAGAAMVTSQCLFFNGLLFVLSTPGRSSDDIFLPLATTCAGAILVCIVNFGLFIKKAGVWKKPSTGLAIAALVLSVILVILILLTGIRLYGVSQTQLGSSLVRQ